MERIPGIKRPVADEVRLFREHLSRTLTHADDILGAALSHLRQREGKLMRPTLLLLCARSCGPVPSEAYPAAVSLELLHTASLVHDDIVDESQERRGQISVNALYGSKASVLVGDYLLSLALDNAARTRSLEVVRLIALLGQQLSEGELLQLQNTRNEDFSEEVYFRVIRRKTATLFATCARVGMMLGGAGEELVEKARQLGDIMGMCFQIRDDILDYTSTSARIGKPVGNDLREGKLTLPLLYALSREGGEEMRPLALKAKRLEATGEDIERLVRFTLRNGGIAHAEKVMEDYRREAQSLLLSIPGEEVRESLALYLDCAINRDF